MPLLQDRAVVQIAIMRHIPVEAAEQAIRLVAEVLESKGTELPVRRQRLISGLAELIGAQVYMWNQVRVDAAGVPTPLSIIDGGFLDDLQRGEFFKAITDLRAADIGPKLVARLTDKTPMAADLVSNLCPTGHPILEWLSRVGIEAGVLGMYRVGKDDYSAFGLHRQRRSGDDGVSEGVLATDASLAVTLVRLVMGCCRSLHDLSAPAMDMDRMAGLTERQRAVLGLLLGGGSRKTIARSIQLSQYTVAEHIQGLYEHFGVNSRAELMSLFITGK
jgi:DNA-binding CsgD family transcriptional regulator